MVTVAAVQATPVFLDREATTDKVCALVKEAAGQGAESIVFPESFIPAYPDWVWRTPAWRDTEFVQRLYANAVSVPGPTLQRVADAAAEASAYVVLGVTEIDGGTLYNTLLYLGPDGRVLQRHRKLMPTGGERTVWGMGDGSELGVVTRSVPTTGCRPATTARGARVRRGASAGLSAQGFPSEDDRTLRARVDVKREDVGARIVAHGVEHPPLRLHCGEVEVCVDDLLTLQDRPRDHLAARRNNGRVAARHPVVIQAVERPAEVLGHV